MKWIKFCLWVSISLMVNACSFPQSTLSATNTSATNGIAEAKVRTVVEDFGKTLQTVSLQSPEAIDEMKDNYSPYVAPELLEKWMNNSSQAPGRIVSSPWPDRIEIITLTKQTSNQYFVTGDLVEVTSVEVVNGGAANKIPVNITVANIQGDWIITEYEQESYQP